MRLMVTLMFVVCSIVHEVGTCSSQDVDQPNILFIMVDDVGCDALACYGGNSFKTPNLDALAETGMLFQHCFSMPVCHPTRICLLTGRYPFRLKHPRWGTFPKVEETNTFAHMMKSCGYATAIAGKWQLAMLGNELDHPHRLGFDQYCLFGWHEGPRYYDPLIWQDGKRREDVKGRYGPDVYCDFLIEFMTRTQRKPFLAYFSMALCHDVTDDLGEPVPHGPRGRYDSYQEMVEAADARVGRLVAALDRLKLRKKTLILFTGDNGTPQKYIHSAVDGKLVREPIVLVVGGRIVRGGKGELTDAGTRVPLIANWLGTILPNQVVDDLVDFSDFLPTFVQLGSGSLPRGLRLDGVSFAPQLRGRSGKSRRWVFSEQGPKHWVRTQRWKLYNDGRLFDLLNDKFEKTVVAASAQSDHARAARTELTQVLSRLAGEN